MRVVVFEPHAGGHRAMYLRLVAAGIRRRGWQPVVATSAAALADAELHAAVRAVDAEIIDVPEPGGAAAEGALSRWQLVLRELAYWRLLRRSIVAARSRGRVDAVVVLYLDYCFHASCVLGAPIGGTTPWVAISMRLAMRTSYTNAMPLKWRLARRLLDQPALRRLGVINPSIRRVPRAWLSAAGRERLRYVVDPAETLPCLDRAAARVQLGVRADALVVLVFGTIDERKGLAPLLRCLCESPTLANVAVLICGPQSPTMRRLLDAPMNAQLAARGALVAIDRFVTHAEQAQSFAAADVVWLGYRGHEYMSGVLVLAGRAGLPVIACREGEIGTLAADEALGPVIDIDDPAMLRGALEALSDREARERYGASGRRAFAGHTPEEFCDGLLEPLASGILTR